MPEPVASAHARAVPGDVVADRFVVLTALDPVELTDAGVVAGARAVLDKTRGLDDLLEQLAAAAA